MIDSFGKIIMGGFVAILLGIILVSTISNDVEQVKVSSVTVSNETLSFTSLTTAISNESHANTANATVGFSVTLTYDDLTLLQAIRNESATIVTNLCNVTLSSGTLKCNGTNSTNIYVDYTYVSGRTDTTTNDELISVTGLRNISSTSIIGACNRTLTSGYIICNNTHSATGYADYTYEPDTYVSDGTSRTVLTLVILFFVLGILAIAIRMAYQGFKEGGIL